MQRNDKLATRLSNCAIWIYILGGFAGCFCLSFFPLAFLIWGITFIFGSLFKAASVIINRLDDIWFAMNPSPEPSSESTETE